VNLSPAKTLLITRSFSETTRAKELLYCTLGTIGLDIGNSIEESANEDFSSFTGSYST